MDAQSALDRLATGLEPVIRYAASARVLLGFEPEPGMLIDTMASFARMLQWIDDPVLRLTLDVGHLFCLGELPIVDSIHRWSGRLVNVHIEDMRAGVHEHLMFGDGQIHFPPIIQAFQEAGYQGGLFVELGRHSHDAVNIARRSFEFLSEMTGKGAVRPAGGPVSR
jgi:sugar phosphate isomerase/epimerase